MMKAISTLPDGCLQQEIRGHIWALPTVRQLLSKGLGFLVSRENVAPRSSDSIQNQHARGRLAVTAIALRAGAASLGLSYLCGTPAPATALPYGEYVPFWEFGVGSHPSNWHPSRGRHRAAKTVETAKPEPPKQPTGPLLLAVSIASQRVTVYDNGTPIATSPISSGMAGHLTPTGVFSVIQKQRWHRSNLYSNAPMPYMQRITWSGVALHAGVLPGYPASHGCIRLPEGFAVRLWGMTRVGARVIVTRNDTTPYEVNHPHLAVLTKAPEPAPEAGTPGAPNAVVNTDKPEIITGGVVAPSTEAGTGGASAPDKRDNSKLPALATSVSAVPHIERVASVDKPDALRPLAEPSAPASTPVPLARGADTPQRSSPISLFVSRKEAKLFVRKGFTPLFDVPITIAHPEMPLGTHVFTANRPTDGSVGVRWLAVSIGYDRLAAHPASAKKHKSHATHDERPVPPTAEALHRAAADALDRVELPPEAVDRIAPLVGPGASLLISDQGLGDETGRDTDFIVVTK
jgi:L,D-transpeptidase catalytic domain